MGRELVESGIEGARAALSTSGRFTVNTVAGDVREQWRIAATAALAGTVIALLADERRRPASGLMGLGLGGLCGLFAAVAWGRRHVVGAAAESAFHQMGHTRDHHWLEHHPINYG